jgi:hypothetical protein
MKSFASGSTTVSASSTVPGGIEPHASGGETLLPSQVYTTGIGAPGSNAELVTVNAVALAGPAVFAA